MADGTVNYYLKYRAPNRKQRFHCIGPATLISCPAARNRAEEILAAAKLGRDIIGEQRAESFEPTVADLAKKHQELHRPPQISEETFKHYECAWRLHIVPLLGKGKSRRLATTTFSGSLRAFPIAAMPTPSSGASPTLLRPARAGSPPGGLEDRTRCDT
jgi:hypothetical protein